MSDALDATTEAAIATGAVIVFIGILLAGSSMGSGEFGATNAYAVIAGVVVFILLMAGVGYWISAQEE